MTSFFGNALGGIGGNPFSTPVGSKVEQATDDTLASENWGLNIEICDLVNETEDGPRDAIKAIRKRLTQNAGKNYTIVMYTLTVLETCVKNCGKRFHVLCCNKDFVLELVKLIGPKNDPPTAVQEKVLSLIQSWADAFKNQPEMAGVVQVYQDLLAKGIEFPATDLDAMAPIFTPQRSVDVVESVEPHQQPAITNAPPSLINNGTIINNCILSAEQKAKLQSELDVVQSNMNVFGEMLNELNPNDYNEKIDEFELLTELYQTCKLMQNRLVELISKLSSDNDITAELLRINDDLNNLFLRYSRWEKNRNNDSNTKKLSASAVLSKAIPPANTNKKVLTNNDSLIDLSDDLNDLQIHSEDNKKKDEFDMFAQSRNLTYESTKNKNSSYKDNLQPNQISGGLSSIAQGKSNSRPDREFDEMADWLGQTTGGEESITSSEFERFLAERAAAAENLPTSSENTRNTPTNTSSTKKNAKDSFFAL